MKIFISCCLLIISISVKAQSKIFERPFDEFNKKSTLKNNPDFNQQKNFLNLQSNIDIKFFQPFDVMVEKLPDIKLSYLHNNNHFIIYKAAWDNIYVVKPDSTIHFNMPVAGNTVVINQFDVKDFSLLQ